LIARHAGAFSVDFNVANDPNMYVLFFLLSLFLPPLLSLHSPHSPLSHSPLSSPLPSLPPLALSLLFLPVFYRYLVGTEDGTIHKCSCSYNEQYLDTYRAHTGPVYKVKVCFLHVVVHCVFRVAYAFACWRVRVDCCKCCALRVSCCVMSSRVACSSCMLPVLPCCITLRACVCACVCG
jgi:hypothetical protein